MGAGTRQIDARLLEDLRSLEEGRELFDRLGMATQFWEQLRLIRSKRESVRAALEPDASPEHGAVLLAALTTLRARLGPFVKDLRRLITLLPAAPWRGEQLERMIGFIGISTKALETVPRWLSDPERYAGEATDRLNAIAGVVDLYLDELRTVRPTVIAPPPAKPPPPSDAAPAPAVALPPGIDAEVLDDLGRVEHCRTLFGTTNPPIETWETVCLVMIDREATKQAVEDIDRLKRDGRTQASIDATATLYRKLVDIRSKYGRFVRRLRDYLDGLPIARCAKDTWEIALGLIIAAPRARQHAQQWLDEPQRNERAAAGHFEDVVRRTIRYQTALRQVAAR